jgi:HD-GYP domain-containing protein (c-di-GMP phosphodiesterase class II)
MSIVGMVSGSDWFDDVSSVSPEGILCATLELEQLDEALSWVLERLQRCPIPMPGALAAVLVDQRARLARTGQETGGTLQSWIACVHDDETSTHVQRVMELAEACARHMAQSEEEIHRLRLAALLHDIGKVGIPVMILHKPGPLMPEEWNIIQRHPDIGRQILERAGGIFHQVARTVGMHHERWDGYGYPGGVAADDIPLHARILAVVDAYDAMISQRVYQQHPYSITQACRELRRCASSQFDPGVIEAFVPMLETYSARAARR